MPITVAVAKESASGEKRVALVPEIARKLADLGVQVRIERGAGQGAWLPDAAYEAAEVVADRGELLAGADLLLTVQPPDDEVLNALPEGATVCGFLAPHAHPERVAIMRDRRLTAFALELVPRISRAQAMDALSSQAAVAGYKAALIAANAAPRFFPMLTTAAGTVRPSKVLVIGAGVAGLQAIATARRLGGIVEGYDVRAETKEQVESLGARFVELDVDAAGEGGYARELTDEERRRQQQALGEHMAGVDVIVTTAAVPGKRAPRIVTRDMVEGMAAGTVIVDLAADGGGNCELTEPGEEVEHGGVKIVGPVNLPSQLPLHASQMYARNLMHFISPLIADGEWQVDWDDQVVAESAVTHAGEIRHNPTRELVEGGAA